MVAIGEPARITYTNYRGETAERTITPKRVWYGISDWHPEPHWFLTAFDHDKNADRDFALRDFSSVALRPGFAAAALWHEAEADRKRSVGVRSKRVAAQIATHEVSAAHFRSLGTSRQSLIQEQSTLADQPANEPGAHSEREMKLEVGP